MTTTQEVSTDLDSVLSELLATKAIYRPKVANLVDQHVVPAPAPVTVSQDPNGLIPQTRKLVEFNRQLLREANVLDAFVALDAEAFAALWQGARDIITKGSKWGWSAKQAAVVIKALTPKPVSEVPEVKVDCPVGRTAISGVVVSVKEVVDHYRSNRYHTAFSYKWTIKDDRGFTVWGTVPSAFEWNNAGQSADLYLSGHRVSFTANITRSDRDASFGFAKRPTKTVVGA